MQAVSAQYLLENNNARAKAAVSLKTETGLYRMPDSSLCLMWVKHFNKLGLMIKYEDHWQCGKPYFTYNYSYDSVGNCVASTISSHKSNFIPVEMTHYYDELGRITSRSPSDASVTFYTELYNYNTEGNLIKIAFSNPKSTKENKSWSNEWDGNVRYEITDRENIYGANNEFKWIVIRKHSCYVD